MTAPVDEDWSYSFSCKMLAPDSLEPVRPWLNDYQLHLSLYVSGYNGKTILRGSHHQVELNMSASDDVHFFASGYLKLSSAEALDWLERFYTLLIRAEIPHQLIMSDELNKTIPEVRLSYQAQVLS